MRSKQLRLLAVFLLGPAFRLAVGGVERPFGVFQVAAVEEPRVRALTLLREGLEKCTGGNLGKRIGGINRIMEENGCRSTK